MYTYQFCEKTSLFLQYTINAVPESKDKIREGYVASIVLQKTTVWSKK